MINIRETYRIVNWDNAREGEFDFSRAFVVPTGVHLADGGDRITPILQFSTVSGTGIAQALITRTIDVDSIQLPREGKELFLRKTRRKRVTGLERILYEDVRAGRFYLEVAAPKTGKVGENAIVRKYLDTEILLPCPKCGLSNWALLRHTVRTVYDGPIEMSCYRITLVCKNCDRQLAGVGISLSAAWERCERLVAGAFRRISGIRISAGKGEIEGTITLDKADVRLRRC